MKKGQILTGTVNRVEFPNRGIVETGEGCWSVKGVLPGQTVKFSVQKVRRGGGEGRLICVEERSGMEQDSPCPHFGECGGCTYLSLPYAEQLEIKKGQVKRLLDQALNSQKEHWEWEGILPSPARYEYRNKMEFTFGDEYKDGPLALGMHKRGSFYDIVTVKDCRIVDQDYRKILAFTRDALEGLPFYHRLRHTGYLRHLLVRKAVHTGEILVGVVTASRILMDSEKEEEISVRPEKRLEYWKNGLLNLDLTGKITGVLHIINDSVADAVRSDRTDILYGQDYFMEELLGLQFRISPFSFFQTNSLGAEVLYETVREYAGGLGSDKIVFDLYSGTGTIAQLMAPAAKKVIGVEIVEEAVKAARENARLNGLHNCEFIAGDVLKVLDEISEKPDMIILDPPRDGVHPKALKKILAYGIDKIVYISCKPTSLARDLETFLANGYMVERAAAVDQFPWTANVETVVQLYHQKSTEYFHVDYEPQNNDYLDKMPATAT